MAFVEHRLSEDAVAFMEGLMDDKLITCYAVVHGVDELIRRDNKRHHKFFTRRFPDGSQSVTHYYQTYGGGPEGGYFVRIFTPSSGTPQYEVFEVERGWGEPFTTRRIRKNFTFIVARENPHRAHIILT